MASYVHLTADERLQIFPWQSELLPQAEMATRPGSKRVGPAVFRSRLPGMDLDISPGFCRPRTRRMMCVFSARPGDCIHLPSQAPEGWGPLRHSPWILLSERSYATRLGLRAG
jgi:hypothetical protein